MSITSPKSILVFMSSLVTLRDWTMCHRKFSVSLFLDRCLRRNNQTNSPTRMRSIIPPTVAPTTVAVEGELEEVELLGAEDSSLTDDWAAYTLMGIVGIVKGSITVSMSVSKVLNVSGMRVPDWGCVGTASLSLISVEPAVSRLNGGCNGIVCSDSGVLGLLVDRWCEENIGGVKGDREVASGAGMEGRL